MGAQPNLSSNATVSLKGGIAVVAGASQGIGLGVALRFARAGASVWIVVRNEQRGKDVVEQLKQAGAPDACYFLADLSSKADVLRAADEIKAAAGEAGVGYLFQTQGGAARPSDLAAPGLDPQFSVQVFSRILLAYELRHTVKHSSVAIAIAGKGGKTFDKDDITLDRFKASGASTYAKIMAVRERNATMLDAAWKELAKDSSPGLQYLHLFPGIVKTNVIANSGQNALVVGVSKVVGVLFGRTIEQYAEIPFYLTANPEGRKLVEREGGFWNDKFQNVGAAPAAEDEDTRKAIWDWLLAQMAR